MENTHKTAPSLTPAALQILLSLEGGKMHGYGIKLDVEERTDGAMNLGSGTLYEAIQRLEREGTISECEGESGDSRKRRYYELTNRGKRLLKSELADLARVVDYARARHLLPERPA